MRIQQAKKPYTQAHCCGINEITAFHLMSQNKRAVMMPEKLLSIIFQEYSLANECSSTAPISSQVQRSAISTCANRSPPARYAGHRSVHKTKCSKDMRDLGSRGQSTELPAPSQEQQNLGLMVAQLKRISLPIFSDEGLDHFN